MIRLTAACEDHPDFRFLARMVDRIVTQECEWTEGILDDVREWRFEEGDQENFLKLSSVKRRYREAGLTFRAHGFFQGGPGDEYALAAARALWLVWKTSKTDAVPGGVSALSPGGLWRGECQ